MQKLVEARIEIDEKVTKHGKLPETMILYAVDKEHMVITAKPIKNLEEEAITKTQVKVISEKNKHVILLPIKIYNFYRLEENDYTIMASDKDPTTIIMQSK
jgi:hypothetical protein